MNMTNPTLTLSVRNSYLRLPISHKSNSLKPYKGQTDLFRAITKMYSLLLARLLLDPVEIFGQGFFPRRGQKNNFAVFFLPAVELAWGGSATKWG